VDRNEQVARALLGSLLALRAMAEIGVDAVGMAEYADLALRAGIQALNIELTPSQDVQLQDEGLMFLHETFNK
jgi:hypothetical protein